MNKVYINYQDFSGQCKKLVEQIKKYRQFKQLKCVYGIPTGGLPLAVHLSKHLNLKLVLDLDDYTGYMGQILICDDILDSGKTMRDVLFYNFEKYLTKPNYLIASLYLKQRSVIKPDFHASMVGFKDWIVFPWEPEDSQTQRDCDL